LPVSLTHPPSFFFFFFFFIKNNALATKHTQKLWDVKCKSRDQLKLIKQKLDKAAEECDNAAKECNKATKECDKANAALTQLAGQL